MLETVELFEVRKNIVEVAKIETEARKSLKSAINDSDAMAWKIVINHAEARRTRLTALAERLVC